MLFISTTVKIRTTVTDYGSIVCMKIKNDVLKRLQQNNYLDALEWAVSVAFSTTSTVYDANAGHDRWVIGTLNHNHLCDLLDRVTSNGKYSLGGDVEGIGIDVLQRSIAIEDFQRMPKLPPGMIIRKDDRNSPCWWGNGCKVYLQSYRLGNVDHIYWKRSKKKYEISLASNAGTLFEPLGEEDLGSIAQYNQDSQKDISLVLAHSFDPYTNQFEAYIGQSKAPAFSGDSSWVWRESLLSGPNGVDSIVPTSGIFLPGNSASIDADDVPVSMKRDASEWNGNG